MKSLINTILLVLVMGIMAFGQRSTITGKVTDTSKQTIVGASVVLKGTVRGVQTNTSGEYIIKGLKAGNYVAVISTVGMKSQETAVVLEENESKTLDFVLEEETYTLSDVQVTGSKGVKGNEHLAEVEGYSINASKKNEVIKLDNINANLAMNNSRQIFSRTPGISVWENDGSGVQLGVASRGLSPNRSWEFNTRMNGYDITPDPMGYPEAYYTPPMEVVDRIEIVRGASSLQYGSQFGGLMNFVLRKPDISTRFTVESQNTTGSNGLFSTFNYIGGTEGRLSYTAYYQKRMGNGWRENSRFDTDHAHLELSYAVSNKLKIGVEATYMMTEIQQAGGLTDAQFIQDSRQSVRARNWFSTPWCIPSVNAEYIFSPKTKLSLKAFSTIAERNSVGNVRAITEVDNLTAPRQVDRDFYTTIGSELRLLTDYKFLGKENTLATGLRYFRGHIDRKQQGRGTNGAGMDFDLSDGAYPRDLDFTNINQAAFFENIFRFNKKLLATLGARVENISSTMEGQFSLTNGNPTLLSPITRNRSFMIFGGGLEYHISPQTEFYSNISQAYRPVLISDLTPPATTDIIDENLQDARGYNFDFGYRGKVGNYLNFDVDYFYVNYNNRIGTITQTNAANQRYQFRTNLGRSVSQGFEGYVEFDPITAFFKKSKVGYLSVFASIAYIDAVYHDFATTSVVNGLVAEGNLAGKRVENAPRKINRFGVTYNKKGFSVTWQLSDIGKAYADASNTEAANAAATTGIIPAYTVQDLSASFKFLKHYNFKAGVNNLTDERYFTRRAGGYPGPGLMPADGRTFYVSGGVKF
ncbi:TonB-dependent receptor [Runella slithyformis]|uniref:TonB-dependent receptor n=1 Tax=Runella slithyformis (strain ATCC 29530 / DSM 19594 / LMG 11500 / NCIMB 11436 / LSU 4) TaxID=761193 RepID=A0A7U4E3T5_RUNSL|nr:TonB-dependent receptor [Runella slithyformis]AEI46554.1 TonB-dependent receptor [Runella slithyformis DSM 19594]